MTDKSKITKDEVLRLANLSRINVNEDEAGKYAEQLGKIVSYVSQLNEVDLNDIEPLYHVLDKLISGRKDEIKSSFDVKKLLQNAPSTKDDFFKVPPVIKGKKRSK
tara:strand:- start:438 stop:755 length:318 start_codon:yes stop_codon:yes gene_type:complete